MFKTILSRLRELQGDNSVSAFARYLEMPQKTVDTYIKGERKPSAEFILRVCAKCDVSADWLLGLSDSRDRREAPSRTATADPTVARISSCGISSCAPSASPALTLRRAARPAEPTLADVMAELQSLKRRVNALESSTTSSLATCG